MNFGHCFAVSLPKTISYAKKLKSDQIISNHPYKLQKLNRYYSPRRTVMVLLDGGANDPNRRGYSQKAKGQVGKEN